MQKIFTGIKVKGKRKTAFGLNRLSWFLLRHNFLFERDSTLYASLKIKVLLTTTIIAIIFASGLSILLMHFGKAIITRQFLNHIVVSSQNIAFSFEAEREIADLAQLNKKIELIAVRNNLHYLILRDQNDKVVGFYDRENLFKREINYLQNRNQYRGYQRIQLSNGTRVHHSVFPVPNNTLRLNGDQVFPGDQSETKLASVLIGFKDAPLRGRIMTWYKQSSYISLAVIAFLFVILYMMVGRMVKPLKQLADATHHIAAGNLEYTITSKRNDELGLLASSFNEMIRKLKESQAKIKQYAQTLEEQVKERTKMLKASEEKYRALFEHSASAVTLLNRNDELTMVNKQFERLSRLHKQDLEGKKTFTSFLRGEDRAIVEEYLTRQKNGSWDQIPFNFECGFYDNEDRERKVNLTMAMLPGSNNILASLVDVTETRELQQKLSRSEQLAAIGELSASIAHEIRNPLGAINTSVGVLMSGLDLQGDDRELMTIIGEEIKRLDKIINDFLKFARLTESELQPTDLNQIINDTLMLFRGLMGETVELHLSLDPDLPIVLGDADQLKQVCINIIMNAIEAMKAGGHLWITTEVVKNGSREMVSLRIMDSGEGIKPEYLKKIFQPFFSTKDKGGGMGLSICDRIIQNHGGFVRVSSKTGEGTEFDIRLPMHQKNGKE